MAMSMGELLVILDSRSADDTLDRLRETMDVMHVASSRLVIVNAETGGTLEERLRSVAGVVGVAAPDAVTGLAGHGLSEEEQLFVDGWVMRQREGADKQRRGDGLPWDADGFQPA